MNKHATNASEPSFSISPFAGDQDLKDLRKLLIEYAEELGGEVGLKQIAVELHNLPGAYAPPEGLLLIARRRQVAAGCVALRRLAPDTCEMRRLFVRSAFRDSGLGRLLGERGLVEARRLGCRRVVVQVIEHALPAIHLYQALGFQPCTGYAPESAPGVTFLERPLGESPSLD